SHQGYSVRGVLNRGEIVNVGTCACGFLDNFASIDLFVCSADGLTPENGITEFNESMVDIKRRMASLSERIVALVDHTKFGRKSLFKSVAAEEIDILITDPMTPPVVLDQYREFGMEILIASDKES
ncbi:MAG: DeoR/GlpR transcriptional regulator, partial [Planctomycetes bacterium]|nr:DeoR/GlpR transcriptional regulator [Planctomycetota bacterium]